MTDILINGLMLVAGFVLGHQYARWRNTRSMAAPLQSHFDVEIDRERVTLHLYNKAPAEFIVGDIFFVISTPETIIQLPQRDVVGGDIDIEDVPLTIPMTSRCHIWFNIGDVWAHIDRHAPDGLNAASGFFRITRRNGNYSADSVPVTLRRPGL